MGSGASRWAGVLCPTVWGTCPIPAQSVAKVIRQRKPRWARERDVHLATRTEEPCKILSLFGDTYAELAESCHLEDEGDTFLRNVGYYKSLMP
jgi:hypothetical protein